MVQVLLPEVRHCSGRTESAHVDLTKLTENLPGAKSCVGHYEYQHLLHGLNNFVHCLHLLGITYKSCVWGGMKSSHGTDWIGTDSSTTPGRIA